VFDGIFQGLINIFYNYDIMNEGILNLLLYKKPE